MKWFKSMKQEEATQDMNLRGCDENLPYKVREAFDKFCALYQEADDAGYSVLLRDTSSPYSAWTAYLATTTPKNLELSISQTIRF